MKPLKLISIRPPSSYPFDYSIPKYHEILFYMKDIDKTKGDYNKEFEIAFKILLEQSIKKPKMKTIQELRKDNPNAKIVRSSIRYFNDQKIDFNVYLPTIWNSKTNSFGLNLQREFCWNIEQKRELIWSIFYGRTILPMAFIHNADDIWEIIDGKQRLSTMLDFYNNKFSILINNEEFYFNNLPDDYQVEIKNFYFSYYVLDEYNVGEYDDNFKRNWFILINFAGTPQEKEHLENISSNI